MHFVNASDFEVGGMGLVSYNREENYFWIREAFLLDQEVSGATTDLDAAAVGKLELEVMGREGNLNFWWHSHVNMQVFWSGTDRATIEKYGNNGFMLATVFNKKREMRTAIAYKAISDFGSQLVFLDELETIIYDSRINKEDLQAEFTAKVRKKIYPKINQSVIPAWQDLDYGAYVNDWERETKKYFGEKESNFDKKMLKEFRLKLKNRIKTDINLAEIEAKSYEFIESGSPRMLSIEAALIGVTPQQLQNVQEMLTQDDLQKIDDLWQVYQEGIE